MNHPHNSNGRRHRSGNADELIAKILRKLDESGRDSSSALRNDELTALSEEQQRELSEARECLDWLNDYCHSKSNSTLGQAGKTIENLQAESAADEQESCDGTPATVGRYRIDRLLGEGGFARVYLAEDRELKRRVALKIPRPEFFLSKDARQRFRREAESAAILAHPAIVPVFESGNEGPILFIAFAFCDGPNLEHYQSDTRIPYREAASIVVKLAEAIQHAHDRGVVHRDLKPGNVLIDYKCEGSIAEKVRITDFGLARQLDSNQLQLTTTGALIGTPAYMSPEQAKGKSDVGKSTDIFSLGVILYELLAGQQPHTKDNYLNTLRAIEEQPPIAPRSINPDIPRDLESVCLKCLRKRPAERYASSYELAEDLSRWLAGRPVVARQQTAIERTSAWIKRNRALSTAIAIAILSLCAGLGTTFVQWQQTLAEKNKVIFQKQRVEIEKLNAERAGEESAKSAERAEKVVSIIVGAFQNADPSLAGEQQTTAIEILQNVQQQVDEELVDDPLTRARLLFELAQSFHGQGEYEASMNSASRSVDLYRDELGPAAEETIRAMGQLGTTAKSLGRHQVAIDIHRAAYEACEAEWGPNARATIRSLHLLTVTLMMTNKHVEALSPALDSHQRAIEHLTEDDPTRLSILRHLASVYRLNGYIDKSLTMHQLSVKRHRKTFGMSPRTVMAILAYSSALKQNRQLTKAIRLSETTLELARDELGRLHPETIKIVEHLVKLLDKKVHREKQLLFVDQLIDLRREKYGDDHPETFDAMFRKAGNLLNSDRFEEALELQLPLLSAWIARFGEFHPRTLKETFRLGRIYRKLERLEDLHLTADKNYNRFEKLSAAEFPLWFRNCSTQLANVCELTGREAQAALVRQRLDEFQQESDILRND